MGDALAEFRGVSEALQQLVALNRAGSTRASQEGDALYAQVRLQTLLAIALMVGVGLFIAVSVTRSVRRQLGGEPADTTETVRRIAGGDLTRPIALEPGDSTSLLAAMKDMQDKLTGMVREIQQSGEAVATASAQIAQGNHDLSSRAGDQGRGFAVVAGEVRALAQRSAEAAKEIKSLIGASVERVEQGTVQVVRAGSTMNEVVQAIRRVTDIMGEIDSASREQATGVAQVGEAVSQMDQATQQNAALVEESAAAADSLKQQAQALVRSAGAFRVDGAPPRAMPGAQAAAAIGRASARSRSAARPLTVAEDDRSGTLRASQPVADRAGPSGWSGF